MLLRRSLLAAGTALPLAAAAQPAGPVTILVGFAPGGIGELGPLFREGYDAFGRALR